MKPLHLYFIFFLFFITSGLLPIAFPMQLSKRLKALNLLNSSVETLTTKYGELLQNTSTPQSALAMKLESLRETYFDPWGRNINIEYYRIADGCVVIIASSSGPDRRFGTFDDLRVKYFYQREVNGKWGLTPLWQKLIDRHPNRDLSTLHLDDD